MFKCWFSNKNDSLTDSDRTSEWIIRKGKRLFEKGVPFSFVSYNIPNLLLVEDRPCMRGTWVLPTLYEIKDAIKSIADGGGKVARSYTLGIGPNMHIVSIRTYNEDAFVMLDHILSESRRHKIRLIIPLINNHFGGDSNEQFSFGDYGLMAKMRGLRPSVFFTNPDLIDDFKHLLSFLLNRVNTVNGIPYKDDSTLLAWQLGNELGGWEDQPPPGHWTVSMAKFIKELSPNVLVADGTLGGWMAKSRYQREALESPFVDMFDNHYYGGEPSLLSDASFITSHRKVFFCGEFGFGSLSWMRHFLDVCVRSSKISGCLIWSLRFHSRDGGFYTHSEDQGFLSYHVPGFPQSKGFAHDEEAIVKLLWDYSHGRTREYPIPDSPLALDNACLSPHCLKWRGAAWAHSYQLRRQEVGSPEWTVLSSCVFDNVESGETIYKDSSASPDKCYVYEVLAQSRDGKSNGSPLMIGPLSL